MAQRTVVILEDDIDGGEASESVSFALDGVSYEIDLSETNAQSLRDVLAPWVSSARRQGGRRRTSGARGRGGSGDQGAMRQWAREHGFEVKDRGQVPRAVKEAYAAATGA